jgi:hypothetical protein
MHPFPQIVFETTVQTSTVRSSPATVAAFTQNSALIMNLIRINEH